MAPKRILVLGGGWAGLAAARTLLDEAPPGSVSVTVLEATNAVGGRSRAAVLPMSGPVELGATWFHGTQGNPIYDFAVRQGVVYDPARAAHLGVPVPGAALSADSGDSAVQQQQQQQQVPQDRWGVELVRPGAAAPLGSAARAAAVAAMGEYGDAVEEIGEDEEEASSWAGGDGAAAAEKAAAKTFGDVLRPRFDEALARQDAAGGARAAFAEGWACRERLQRAYDGFHSCDSAGAAFAREYHELEGPNIPVPGGYQHLAERLAAGLDIRLSNPVAAVRWGGADAHPPSNGAAAAAAGPVGVTLQNGESFEADAIICTFSLGVLKAAVAASEQLPPGAGGAQARAAAQVVRFEPQLPEEKVGAIRALHIGYVNKLFVEFDPPLEALPPGGNPCANGAAAAAAAAGERGVDEGAEGEACTPQPPPLAYSSKPAAAPAAADDEQGLVGPRRRVQASQAPGGLAATTTPDGGAGGAAGAAAGGAEGAAAAADEAGSDAGGGGAAAGPRLTSYCLLWPTRESLWGASGVANSDKEQDLLPLTEAWRESYPDLPTSDAVFLGPRVEPADISGGSGGGGGEGLPGWLYGLHSWRYSDGPEWCKPPDGFAPAAAGVRPAAAVEAAAAGGGGAFAPRRELWERLWLREWPGRGGYCAVLWVTGRAALALEEMTDDDVIDDVTALLDAFPAVPRPAGAAPRAACVLRSEWCLSPYFRGSYSYPGPEADGDTIDALAAPLLVNGAGGGALCFAGEATSRHHTGCVHGAYLSGQREARRLVEMWGLALEA